MNTFKTVNILEPFSSFVSFFPIHFTPTNTVWTPVYQYHFFEDYFL